MVDVSRDDVDRVEATAESRSNAAELALAPDELLELLLDGVVELEAVAVEHLEAVVVGRVVRGRDHDPRGEGAVRARYASAGVGTTPTTWTSTPRLVAPAVSAATNMSPDRRVSWPTTIDPPPHQPVRGRPPEGVGDGRLQVDVGDAADTVRAEEV